MWQGERAGMRTKQSKYIKLNRMVTLLVRMILLGILCFSPTAQSSTPPPPASSSSAADTQASAAPDPNLPTHTTEVVEAEEEEDDEEEFMFDDEPPPGFEDDMGPEEFLLKVKAFGRTIGLFEAMVGEDWIQFLQPEKVIKAISGLKNQAQLIEELRHKQSANFDAICERGEESGCGYLIPKRPIELIYDDAEILAELFIRPNFIAKPGGMKFVHLDHSKTGISANVNTFLRTSGSIGTGLSPLDIYIASSISKARTALNLTANIDQNGRFLPAETYVSHYLDSSMIRAGFITTFGGQFLSSENIFGVSLSSQEDTVINEKAFTMTPVLVYAAYPAIVNVYRSGKILIYTTRISAGYHYLNTSTFPAGSYDIDVEVTDVVGKVSKKSLYFVSRQSMPMFGHDRFNYSVGLIESNISSSGGVDLFPKLSKEWIYAASRLHRYSGDIAVGYGFATTIHHAYFSPNILFLGRGFTFEGALVVGSHGDYGYSSSVSKKVFGFNASVSGRHIYNHQSEADLKIFSPIVSSSSSFTVSLSRPVMGANLGLTYNRVLSEKQTPKTFYGFELSKKFQMGKKVKGSWNLVGSSYNGESLIGLNVGIDVVAPFNVNVNVGYDYEKYLTHKNHPDGDASRHSGVTVGSSSNREHQWTLENSDGSSVLNGSETYGINNDLQQVLFNLNYMNPMLEAEGSASYVYPHDRKLPRSLTYTLSGEAAVSWVQGGGIDLSRHTSGSGVMFNVGSKQYENSDSQQPAKFVILNRGRENGLIKLDNPEFIGFPPFQELSISIRPEPGFGIFEYDDTPQKIVLYPKNTFVFKQEVVRKIIVLARIVDESEEPISGAELINGDGMSYTDEGGEFESEVKLGPPLKFIKNDGEICTVSLPKHYRLEFGIAEVGDLKCIDHALA